MRNKKEAELFKKAERLRDVIQNDNQGTVKNIKSLIEADPKIVNFADEKDGLTPIMLAAKSLKKSDEVIQLLLSAGAHADSVDFYGNTALHWAIASANLKAFSKLVQFGLNINVANADGVTPLMALIQQVGFLAVSTDPYAARIGQEFENQAVIFCRMLSSTQIQTKDKDGNTPLSLAKKADSKVLVEALLDRSASIPPPYAPGSDMPLPGLVPGGLTIGASAFMPPPFNPHYVSTRFISPSQAYGADQPDSLSQGQSAPSSSSGLTRPLPYNPAYEFQRRPSQSNTSPKSTLDQSQSLRTTENDKLLSAFKEDLENYKKLVSKTNKEKQAKESFDDLVSQFNKCSHPNITEPFVFENWSEEESGEVCYIHFTDQNAANSFIIKNNLLDPIVKVYNDSEIYLSREQLEKIRKNEWSKQDKLLDALKKEFKSNYDKIPIPGSFLYYEKDQTLGVVNILINNLEYYLNFGKNGLQSLTEQQVEILNTDTHLSTIRNEYSIAISLLMHRVDKELSLQPYATLPGLYYSASIPGQGQTAPSLPDKPNNQQPVAKTNVLIPSLVSSAPRSIIPPEVALYNEKLLDSIISKFNADHPGMTFTKLKTSKQNYSLCCEIKFTKEESANQFYANYPFLKSNQIINGTKVNLTLDQLRELQAAEQDKLLEFKTNLEAYKKLVSKTNNEKQAVAEKILENLEWYQNPKAADKRPQKITKEDYEVIYRGFFSHRFADLIKKYSMVFSILECAVEKELTKLPSSISGVSLFKEHKDEENPKESFDDLVSQFNKCSHPNITEPFVFENWSGEESGELCYIQFTDQNAAKLFIIKNNLLNPIVEVFKNSAIYLSREQLEKVRNEWSKQDNLLDALKEFNSIYDKIYISRFPYNKKHQTLEVLKILINNLEYYLNLGKSGLQSLTKQQVEILNTDTHLSTIRNEYSIAISLLMHRVDKELSLQPYATLPGLYYSAPA